MAKGKKKPATKKKKAAAEPVNSEAATEEAGPQVVDISALPIWNILPFFIRILDSVAWQKMGLIVNPMTQEIEKDLVQARVAIDSYEALLSQLGDKIDLDTKKALSDRLADLKLNFATQA
ncbi:MAG: DUF1844 domain-containing protein [Promethearchaeota archaeon]